MKNQKGVIIRSDNSKSVVEFEIGKSYELIKNTVGGLIEVVRLENADLWVNENGIAERLPLNLIATALYSDTFGATNPILGDTIITASDDEGETIGLTDEQVAHYLAYDKKIIPTAFLLR